MRKKSSFKFSLKMIVPFFFSSEAKVTHEILDPESKQVVGLVRREKEVGFDWKRQMFGVRTTPVRFDIRETEDGPNLLSLLISRSAASQMTRLARKVMTYEILDAAGQSMGAYSMKEGMFTDGMTFQDPNEQVVAEVKWRQGVGMGLVVQTPDGRELGLVTSVAMAEASDAAASGKIKFSASFGPVGHLAIVHSDAVGQSLAHQLVLALAAIVETTGMGKNMTGGDRFDGPSPSRGGRRRR